MTDKPIDLDQHRGMSAQKATVGMMPPRRRATCSICLLRRWGLKTRVGRSLSRPFWPISSGFPAKARAKSLQIEAISPCILVEHDLFGKPVSTFPEHALANKSIS
jgi:hypothetical protein